MSNTNIEKSEAQGKCQMMEGFMLCTNESERTIKFIVMPGYDFKFNWNMNVTPIKKASLKQ